MPFADNRGIRIHYALEGSGAPLVLQHGFSLSHEQWYYDGFVEPLKADYRLIIVDARGHGLSDKPHDASSYSVRLMASDVTAVLDDLGIDKAHFCGYSMGGRIGFAIGAHYPDRALSLILGGCAPHPSDLVAVKEEIPILRRGMDAYLANMEEAVETQLPEWFRRLVVSNDRDALIACNEAVIVQAGQLDLLSRMTMPCLVLAGDRDSMHDQALAATEMMPNAEFVSIKGHGHIIPTEVWLPVVQEFLQKVQAGARH